LIFHFSIIFVVKSIIKFYFYINAFNRGNLTIDIVNSNNSNNNSNSNNSYNNISNSIISNFNNSIENNVYVDSSVCVWKKCLISFLGEEVLITVQGNGRIYLSVRWNQVLILILHSWWLLRLFFNRLYLIAIGQQWSLFNRFKSNRTTTTKNVNAEETGRQASRSSAINEDYNIIS